jgi:uncharacterized membrane protein
VILYSRYLIILPILLRDHSAVGSHWLLAAAYLQTCKQMYRLMQELQRQIHSKCELMGDEKALEELREQEEEELREQMEAEKKAAGNVLISPFPSPLSLNLSTL